MSFKPHKDYPWIEIERQAPVLPIRDAICKRCREALQKGQYPNDFINVHKACNNGQR